MMMRSITISITLALVTIVSVSTVGDCKDGGFSVQLIHRDSLNSPFYNPSSTAPQRVSAALRRSYLRAPRFSATTNTPQAPVTDVKGEYVLNISLGTPPFPVVAIADTGSDLIWTQCKPCENCFREVYPLFDHTNSSSYRNVACETSQCRAANEGSPPTCTRPAKSCSFSVSYGDQSYANGDVATETVTLTSTSGRPVRFPKTVIGCGHDSNGTFNDKTSGIIGLGGGAASLVTQISNSIAGKLSYCLVPITETSPTSKLNFGSNAVVSGGGTVSTAIIKDSRFDTFYNLHLEAVSVDGQKIKFPAKEPTNSAGNIIIDSGTTLTLLPIDFYGSLESAVEAKTKGRRVDDPTGMLSLCYSSGPSLELPEFVVHFDGGADVKLKDYNFFVEVEEGISCFSFAPYEGVAIYGNLAQANFLVGYDLVKGTVSFKPADCGDN